MTLRSRTYILFAGFLWSALLFGVPPAAKAGLVLGPPIYLGLSSGLVGWWTMDGADTSINNSGVVSVFDRSGNGNNAKENAASSGMNRVSGKIGQGMDFKIDGSKPYLNVPASASINNLAKFTATAWIKARSSGFDTGSGGTNGRIIEKCSSCTAGWFFDTEDGGDNSLDFVYTWSTTPGEWTTPTNSEVYNTWQFVAVSFDNSSVSNAPTMYINGVPQTLTVHQISAGSAGDDSGNPLTIGNRTDQGKDFDGIIDDLRLYNRVLTKDEIKRLYKIGSTLKFGAANSSGSLSQGLAGWWTFDGADIAGTHAYDRSGNANNGVIASGPSRTNGKIGQAMAFHQESNGVQIFNSASFANIHNITVSAWIKMNTIPTCGGDVNIVNKASLAASGWTFRIPCNLTNSLVFTRNFTGASDPGATASNNVIGTGRWYHVLATDASTTLASDIHIYVNGAEVTYQATSDGIGGQKDDSGFDGAISDAADGTIDDVRIYNRVLTKDEIKRLYNLGGTEHVGVASSNGSLSQGLVGYWTMDGKDTSVDGSGIVTVIDRSGNNSTASSDDSATAPTRARGKIGQALHFLNQVLPIQSDPANLQITTSFTIAAWVKSDSINAGTIFGRADSNVDGYSFVIDGGSDCTDGTYNVIETTLGSSAPGFVGWCGGTRMTLGKWYHVASVYNSVAQTIHSYVNGVEDGGSICSCGDDVIPTAFNPTGLGPAVIGGDGGNRNNKFNGSIDDVRVWNRPLSASEIKRLYNMGR